jgi:hypothetical protein
MAKPWERNWSAPAAPSAIGGPIIIKDADPTYATQRPIAEAKLKKDGAEADITVATRDAQIERQRAEALKAKLDAAEAQINLNNKQREAASQPDPKLAKVQQQLQTDDILSTIGSARSHLLYGYTTGVPGAVMRNFQGSEANDLSANYSTLKANLAFDRLQQMRDASKTGGALGGVSEGEEKLLGSSVASLDHSQSRKQQIQALDTIEKHYRSLLAIQNGEDPRDPAVAERYKISGAPPAVVLGSKKSDAAVIGGPNVPPAPDGKGGGGQGPTPPAPASPLSPATGPMRTEDDPDASARLEALIRSGASMADIQKAAPGTDPDQVNRVRAYLVEHPDYSGFAKVRRGVPNSLITRTAATPFGTAVASAGDAIVPAGFFGADAKSKLDTAKAMYPGAGMLGTIIGGIPAAGVAELGAARLLPGAGAWATRAADAAYGAYQGAGGNPDDRLAGAIEGGVGGVAGGMIGRGIVRGVGNAVRGVTNKNVQYLRESGVPLTAGQALGGITRSVEDKLTSFPIVGDLVKARRLESMQGWNRELFDQVLDPLSRISGYTGPTTTNGVIGEQGVDIARDLRSRGYDAALGGVHVQADPQFNQDYAASVLAGRDLPDPMAARSDFALRQAGQQFDPNTGALDGPGFQNAIRGIRRARNENAREVNGYDLGQVMGQGEQAFTSLLDRQAPGVVADFNTANEVNRNFEIVRDFVNRARNGTRTGETGLGSPSQLADAAAANAKKYGNTAGTTDQPFFDLTRAGQAVLPSKEGDSGTAGRVALGSLIALAGGGGGYSAYGDSDSTGVNAAEGAGGSLTGLAGLTTLAALGSSRTVQRGLVTMLLDRPDVLRRLGTSIYDNATIGGVPFAVLGSQAPSLLPTQ